MEPSRVMEIISGNIELSPTQCYSRWSNIRIILEYSFVLIMINSLTIEHVIDTALVVRFRGNSNGFERLGTEGQHKGLVKALAAFVALCLSGRLNFVV